MCITCLHHHRCLTAYSPCLQFGRAIPAPLADDAESSSFSSRISAAFRLKRWAAAYDLLLGMRVAGESPKLGALQRWVRDCDLKGGEADTIFSAAPALVGPDGAESTVQSSLSLPLPLSPTPNPNPSLCWLLLDAVMRAYGSSTNAAPRLSRRPRVAGPVPPSDASS